MRSLLTAFGIFWGLFMLMMLLGAGKGVENGFLHSFNSDMAGYVRIQSFRTSVAYAGFSKGRSVVLRPSDLQYIKSNVSGVKLSAFDVYGPDKSFIQHDKKSGNYTVLGVSENYFDINQRIKVIKGRKFDALDFSSARKVLLVGDGVAKRLFSGAADPIGKLVRIGNVNYTTIGVLDGGSNKDTANQVLVSAGAYANLFGAEKKISTLYVMPDTAANHLVFEGKIENLLKKSNDIAPTDDKALLIENFLEKSEKVRGIFNNIKIFVWVVGIGTLVAGTVGLGNIMMVSVKDRVAEIGLKKALGATSISVVAAIVVEAMLITALGGGAGLLFGTMMLRTITPVISLFDGDSTYFSDPDIDLKTTLSAFVVLFSVGVIASLIPAWCAAKISPAEAMRAKG
ncbi:ABC transporter permease [Rugamonas sp. DEMB1]|uniref:ABC transporter permease n=1 Tax=Rugamonas sp. DEMB1 TaxID=3039386 RepID=UPI00244BC4CF|nr:ABC transporter permease [Rugamonas sp. DEMB1]WGG53439.1 ABC transporter permease [Rugamonas sp. DEMB1]